jgi:RNA polymerase sigma factor (sigma-70 family)
MMHDSGPEEDDGKRERPGARVISFPGKYIPSSEGSAPAALTAAYLAHRDEIHQFLRRRTGCEETARDLLHEVWLRVARLEDMPVPARPIAYLQRIATNLALDHVRKAGFRARWVQESDAGDWPSLDAPDVERQLHARNAVAHLRKAIVQLPERRRQVFILCEFDGLTAKQAGVRLGISHRTVETQFAKAIATLRRVMVEANLWP